MNLFRNSREREGQSEVLLKLKELPHVARKEWAMSIREEEPEQLKLHVYNFLIMEGHFDVAKTFAEEAGLSMKILQKN